MVAFLPALIGAAARVAAPVAARAAAGAAARGGASAAGSAASGSFGKTALRMGATHVAINQAARAQQPQPQPQPPYQQHPQAALQEWQTYHAMGTGAPQFNNLQPGQFH